MVIETEKKVEYLVADTTAFIQNAPLQVHTTFLLFVLCFTCIFVEHRAESGDMPGGGGRNHK